MIDPVELTSKLVRCRSVTPDEGGALALLQATLEDAGFTCTRVDRGGVCNLFAKWESGDGNRVFGFNGHVDVVPPGDPHGWTVDPFGGEIEGGRIWGRGAADMKSGVAAFVAAAADFTESCASPAALALAITGDEEGIAQDGTLALLDWMEQRGERMDACLVGEPTCREFMGEMMKIGRRGSLSVRYDIGGEQGHTAYPERANNPLNAATRLAGALVASRLDEGSSNFSRSTLALTSIDTGNTADNVIPGKCTVRANIRFNDLHSGRSLASLLREEADKVERECRVRIEMSVRIQGESFLTPPGPLSDLVAEAVESETGHRPLLSTSGGTSDARFIKNHCPVVEFGLVGTTMHKADEHVEIDDILTLKAIYSRILDGFFA